MAFLQETPRSLRLYFLVFGGLTAASVIGSLSAFTEGLSSSQLVDMILALLPTAVFAADFLYAGIRLPYLLALRPKRLEQVVYTAIAMAGLQAVLALRTGFDPAAHQLRGPLWGFLISLYLLANIRRLASETPTKPAA